MMTACFRGPCIPTIVEADERAMEWLAALAGGNYDRTPQQSAAALDCHQG